MMDVCVTYLMFSAFKFEYNTSNQDYNKRLTAYLFYRYAARYWHAHARLCSAPSEPLLRFLQCRDTEAIWATVHADYFRSLYDWTQVQLGEFHLAVKHGLHKAAEVLPQRMEDLNALYVNRTPLYMAVEGGHMNMVRILLRKGAQVRVLGGLPVLGAFCHGIYDTTEVDVAIVEGLLDRGAEIADAKGNCPLLVKAAGLGRVQLVDLLVQRGAKVESLGPRAPFTFKEVTPLCAAVANGHITTAMSLWKHGANPNRMVGGPINLLAFDIVVGGLPASHKAAEGLSALHEAAKVGHEPLVRAFLGLQDGTKCASPRDPPHDISSGVFLDHALGAENQDSSKEIVASSVPIAGVIELRDKSYGYTPLAFAAQSGHLHIAKLLLRCGANIEAEDYWGETPLLLAAQGAHVEMVQLLLDEGANIEAVDNFKPTPLSVAAVPVWNARVVQLLLEKGANPLATDCQGHTALIAAARTAQETLILLNYFFRRVSKPTG